MIDKLDLLIALAREQHFGRAAEAQGVSQQTLSAAVKSLEERFGVLLVQRGSRFQGFTQEGQRVLHWARRISSDTRAMLQDVASLGNDLVGTIRLSCIPTALPATVRLTEPFRERHPHVGFSIESATSSEILQRIEDLETDAGLTYIDDAVPDSLMQCTLYNERYVLFTTKDGAFAGQSQVSWTQAGSLPLCLLTENMRNRRMIEAQLRSVGVQPKPTIESNSMVALMAHVRTGKWASIMPALLTKTFALEPNIRAIPITTPEFTYRVGLVVARRTPQMPLIAALVEEAKNAARSFAYGVDSL
jgi:DNA-binding transcriptional LysR family regulator